MHSILVYADSLSWGIIPGTRNRLGFDHRWPGVMEKQLLAQGVNVRVIENCLNGRRTAWDDPFRPGRNGLQGLSEAIEYNSPLSLVILMLGSNDFQASHQGSAALTAQGMSALIDTIRRAPIEPGMPQPSILVVAPPQITDVKGTMAAKFVGAETRSIGLAAALKQMAHEQQVYFVDSDAVTDASEVDGIHLDIGQHQLLGQALAGEVLNILVAKNAS